MHGTLKAETAMPPKASATEQNTAFRQFRHEYNNVRPHEAHGQRPPSEIYAPSPRAMPSALPEMVYPSNYLVRRVKGGSVDFDRRARFYVHHALADQLVGFKQVDDRFWQVFFGPVELGVFDVAMRKLTPTRKTYDRVTPKKSTNRVNAPSPQT
jgi:hypothetical protein